MGCTDDGQLRLIEMAEDDNKWELQGEVGVYLNQRKHRRISRRVIGRGSR